MTRYKKPSKRSMDPEEHRLGVLLGGYTRPDRATADPEFLAKIEELCPSTCDSSRSKQQILEWVVRNHTKPSPKVKDPEERRLGRLLKNYRLASSGCQDLEFVGKVDELLGSSNG